MTPHGFALRPEQMTVMAVAGFVFGLAYFTMLRRTALLLVTGRGWLLPVAFTLGRIGAAVIVFGLSATLGAVTLLTTLLGFVLGRAAALRAVRRAR